MGTEIKDPDKLTPRIMCVPIDDKYNGEKNNSPLSKRVIEKRDEHRNSGRRGGGAK